MTELIDALKEFVTNPMVVLVGTVTLIEIVPIKINPWKSLLKWIGNVVNAEDRKQIKEIKDELNDVRRDLSEMKHEREEDKAKQMRWHILDFANACRHGRTHTREAWNHAIMELREYEAYTERKKITNGVIEEDAKYLRELFQENNRTNNFL